MQQNILKNSSITKIYLTYTCDEQKRKEVVSLRFMDKKVCYFASPTPAKFNKPKKKTPAELSIYTTEGVYRAKVTIIDCNMALRDVMFEVTVPLQYDYVQLRASSRKIITMPVTIKWNDDYSISAMTHDIALGGISLHYVGQISSIYKKLPAVLELEFPENDMITFPERKLVVNTKFVREATCPEYYEEGQLYIFKFVNMPNNDETVLKNFLISTI